MLGIENEQKEYKTLEHTHAQVNWKNMSQVKKTRIQQFLSHTAPHLHKQDYNIPSPHQELREICPFHLPIQAGEIEVL